MKTGCFLLIFNNNNFAIHFAHSALFQALFCFSLCYYCLGSLFLCFLALRDWLLASSDINRTIFFVMYVIFLFESFSKHSLKFIYVRSRVSFHISRALI